MLTCIACSKQLADSGEETARGTPSTKDAGKSLTAQIKDIALKFSGAYRQCKPSTSSSNYHKSQRHYSDFDSNSEGNSYLRAGSSSSTPAWDFNNLNRDFSVLGSDMRHKGPMTGDHGGEESKYNSTRSCNVVLVDEDESKEWMAQVEPGVHITFISLPHGGNDLKRIRFSREMFNKWQAQRWWGENYDRIMELYNVQKFNRQALPTPPRSEDEKDSYMGSARESPITPSVHKERLARNSHKPISTSNAPSKGCVPLLESSEAIPHPSNHVNIGSSYTGNGNCGKGETSSVDASRTTTSSREEASVSLSNASDAETEWVEQDEPGVYITIRALLDGTRELRRVRFSRERFGEAHAKLWWEENRERIQAQYL